MPVSTGCETLDRMLNGGIPEQRSVLVTGGPGLGKSTFGMQFLQTGVNADEECVYITTEQTEEELRSSFRDFKFDIDHPDLTIASVHAKEGQTLESGEEELTLQTIEGEELVGSGFSAPFEIRYIEDYLERFGPADRVVFDSVSGLSVLDDNPHHVRRAVLDLIRLFTDQFEATTVFTAERFGAEPDSDVSPTGILEFATHGVLQFWRERVQGNQRRFLKILKMRGIDHDTRTYEFGISERGLYLTPRNWTHQFEFKEHRLTPTNVKGLDTICGGGLLKGKPVLLEHDGRAPVDALVVSMAAGAFDVGMGVWIVPSPVLNDTRFNGLLPDDEKEVSQLLDENLLFVLDVFNAWDEYADHPNVYQASTSGWLAKIVKKSRLGLRFAKHVLKDINDRRDRPVLAPTYTEAFLHMFDDPMQIRDLYYWALENVTVEDDTAFYVHNPATMDPKLAEFFSYDAAQVFETWKHDTGIQYLLLDKSPTGDPGSLSVVEYNDEPPYVSVTRTMNQ